MSGVWSGVAGGKGEKVGPVGDGGVVVVLCDVFVV